MDELVGWSCYYVPHFYYDYYVYKYTLGMTVALAIVNRILKGNQQQVTDYLNFLKSGGSLSLIHIYVDICNRWFSNDCFSKYCSVYKI